MLCQDSYKSLCSLPPQTNIDLVEHVHIDSTDAMKQFVGSFSNATELTLSKVFNIHQDSIGNNLDRIIRLKQLTKLVIDCSGFYFEYVIELLNFIPNIKTLELSSILLHRTNCVSIQQNKTFQIVSKTNTIINLSFTRECTLDKIQLLTILFPRLEYLTMNSVNKNWKSKAQFLLSKSNNNTRRYLSLLCISRPCKDLVEYLTNLNEAEKLLHDYTIKVIDRKLYLWW